jgi:hypothetical protein
MKSMLEKLIQKTGLDWRFSTYQRYLFYFAACENYKDLIRFDRTKQVLQKIILGDGSIIQFQDADQAIQIFLEIWS